MWVTSTLDGQGVGIDGETVVLRGDGDAAVAQVLDGLVAAAVAEFELEGLAADGVAEDLVAEADGEDGFARQQDADLAVDVVEGGGIAGAVGEENAVGLQGEHVLGGGAGIDDRDLEAGLAQAAQDVVLHAEIIGDDVVPAVRGQRR